MNKVKKRNLRVNQELYHHYILELREINYLRKLIELKCLKGVLVTCLTSNFENTFSMNCTEPKYILCIVYIIVCTPTSKVNESPEL